ncbi:MAG: hypothetical protein LBL26_05630 [Peptococcaceae bacterium]|jgi:hypothetical protein|nr:hypothetical protein [Peptococcaceae bacterium]
MANEKQTPRPSIFRSLLITIVVLAIIIAMIMGLGMLGLPSWPLIFFLFYFTTIAGMRKDKLAVSAAGGFIGMTAGFSQGLLTLLTGNETAGTVGFLILVVVLVTLVVDGRVKAIDPLCMMMLTCLTSFTGITPPGIYLSCVVSYAVAVALFAVITTLLANAAAKKEGAAETQQ